MATKKATKKRNTKGARTRRQRNPEGIARVWGDSIEATPQQSGNGATKARTVLSKPKRNLALTPEEEALRANELTLRAWERIYANRGKRLTD